MNFNILLISNLKIHYMKFRNIYFSILFISFVLIIVFSSCNNNKNGLEMTKKDAMDYFINNSPERGAIFYKNNRAKYPFLDQLYMDSIYPAIESCSYYELKNIYITLKDSPVAESVKSIMDISKSTLQEALFEELTQNMQLEQKIFKEEILPIMEIGLDSIIHDDVKKMTDEYAGGFLNYKKLYFFVGKDFDDFKKLWMKYVDNNKYSNYINSMSTNYLNIICTNKQEYLQDITGRNVKQKFDLKIKEKEFKISDDIVNYVKEFTSKEKKEMTNDAIKDWIAPVAIGLLTGGTGAALYEIGSTGYDVKVTIDDIKEQKMDSNDMLMYICEDDIHNQIKEKYLNEHIQQVLNKIIDINQRTYNLIALAL